jgi:hypothetical protein
LENVLQENTKIISISELNNSTFSVGTSFCEIIEFRANKTRLLMNGHYDLQVMGICVDKNRNWVFSCGEDGVVTAWAL